MTMVNIYETSDFNNDCAEDFVRSVEQTLARVIRDGAYLAVSLSAKDFRRGADLETCGPQEIKLAHGFMRFAHIVFVNLPGNRIRVFKDWNNTLGGGLV